MIEESKAKKCILIIAFFVLMFFVGRGTAVLIEECMSDNTKKDAAGNWGLSFQNQDQTPVGNATPDELKQHNAYYVGDTSKKVIYLTFDAGYENGNTAKILDALKKHNVCATFFLVGNFVDNNKDLVKRMADEGHIVGNHTYHHPDMGKISDQKSFEKELTSLADSYKNATGKDIMKFYRPPQGKYSVTNLEMAKEMGYTTVFWSLAYVDWYDDKQPTKEEAFKKLLGRIHPGAIVLLHSTSRTNGEILDELLTKWEEMGYTFEPITNLQQNSQAGSNTGNESDSSTSNNTDSSTKSNEKSKANNKKVTN